ncbi:T-complex protein 1 subunit beta [Tanacetum coccineum]
MAAERLFKDEVTEEKGERARMASFVGAMAIADLVKTTLGPKGMDKLLQSTGRGRVTVYERWWLPNLKSLHIDKTLLLIVLIWYLILMRCGQEEADVAVKVKAED